MIPIFISLEETGRVKVDFLGPLGTGSGEETHKNR